MDPESVLLEGSYRKEVRHRPLRKFFGEDFRLLRRMAREESSGVAHTV